MKEERQERMFQTRRSSTRKGLSLGRSRKEAAEVGAGDPSVVTKAEGGRACFLSPLKDFKEKVAFQGTHLKRSFSPNFCGPIGCTEILVMWL